MISSVEIVTPSGQKNLLSQAAHAGKVVLGIPFADDPFASFDFRIRFSEKISQVRNHDYTWIDAKDGFVATSFSPKVLKLVSGKLVSANIASGIWEICADALLWRFNPENAHPITKYVGSANAKTIEQAQTRNHFPTEPALLFSSLAIEFSRSPNRFSAIACFTDHCDYDTRQSLELQRALFKRHGIKTTKGFFLNHFSKRQDNASWENDADELKRWEQDGHELTYHSLSQSIKTVDQSKADFFGFTPPVAAPTYIDHGYQPYNFTLFEQYGISSREFSQNLSAKGVKTLWNYIDSGTAVTGVINQLNPKHLTLSPFVRAYRSRPVTERLGRIIKNVMFHYYADERIILAYGKTASGFKKVVMQRKFREIPSWLGSLIETGMPLLRVALAWPKSKHKTYKLGKYTPVFFKHHIGDIDFTIFQTLDMVDFKQALSPENINLLIAENGLFIAHTYFSVPMAYHTGRIFASPDAVQPDVESNFAALGEKIASGEIWNPTLDQLKTQFDKFETLVLDCDTNGKLTAVNDGGLHSRTIS